MERSSPLPQEQFEKIRRYIEKACLRLLWRTAIEAEGRIDADAFIAANFRSLGPEDEEKQILADLAANLLFNISGEIRAIQIIHKLVSEIDDAYKAILQEGGGWRSQTTSEDRQAAVIAWFDRHEASLSCLKKSYLENLELYKGGRAGQEKREFRRWLLKEVFEEMGITSLNTEEILTCLKFHDEYKREKVAGRFKDNKSFVEMDKMFVSKVIDLMSQL